jgi:hypothetical protein
VRELPGQTTGVRAAARGQCLSDLVRIVGSAPFDTHLAEILLERADRILTADGGRECKRMLTDVEIDLLLAGDEPDGRHMTGPAPELCGKPPPFSMSDQGSVLGDLSVPEAPRK